MTRGAASHAAAAPRAAFVIYTQIGGAKWIIVGPGGFSEALREELGEMITYELSDPRIGDATVTEVLVSPDMRHAQVRLHMGASVGEQQATIRALDGAKHFLRRQLAERLNLFRVPELHFEADVKLAINSRMDHLMKRVRRGRPRDSEQSQ